MLYGRDEPLAAIDRLLVGMRSGRAGSLVLSGEAGIGKTALLDAAQGRAGAQVLRVTGVESEAELPFAALHALLRPALDGIGTLPEPQAEALRGAFGIAESAVADRFLAGLGRRPCPGVDGAAAGEGGAGGRGPPSAIADAAGNPLALIEVSRGLSGPQRAGSVTPLPAGSLQPTRSLDSGRFRQLPRRPLSRKDA
jgi:hypothetical protein